MGGGVRPGQSCGSSHISAGQIDAAHQDLRDVCSDALAVGDLTIGLIELLAMLWGESGDVRRSARLLGTSEAVRAEIPHRLTQRRRSHVAAY